MKYRRILSLVLALVTVLSLASPAFAAQKQNISVSPIDVMVGGKVFLPTDPNGKNVPVFEYNGTTYAPLRALAEAYGLTVGYNKEKNLATVDGSPSGDFAGSKGTAKALTKKTTIAVSPINIEVGGKVFQPKDPNGKAVSVFVYEGTTYAPLRALAEAYGLTVGYDSTKHLATVDFVPMDYVDFSTILQQVNAERKSLFSAAASFDGYRDYLVNDSSAAGLLTAAEMQLLRSTESNYVETVTAAEAAGDMDLLFRALHVGYGAYYYFGKDAFDRAEAEVMDWLKGKDTVSVKELKDVLRESLAFMVDGHSYVAYPLDNLDGMRYEYHYCTAQQYSKDDKGYYKTVNGKRADFVSFSDSRVAMEPTLLSSGNIVYSPVLFCPDSEVSAATVTLRSADGTTHTETINWTNTRGVSPMRAAEYHYLEENGIAYISVSSFHDQGANAAVYEEFVRTGAQMRDCKAIIFDLRSNGGGNGASMYRWVESFTGIYPELREARAERKSILNSGYTQSVYEGIRIGRGSWISNNIPIIVLMNDACGSAGESALNLLRGMENVLVVGSNSAGYQLGGNAEVITLPNTGITAQIGTQLRFMFEVENVDLKGYEPDVWCDPDQALGAAMNLLVKNGLTTEETVQSLQKTATEIRAEITLGFYQYTVWPGNGFGSNGGSHTITVYCNGEPVQDFTVSSANPSACTVEKTANGTFRLTSKGPGLTAITVQCGSRKEVFYWNSNSQ